MRLAQGQLKPWNSRQVSIREMTAVLPCIYRNRFQSYYWSWAQPFWESQEHKSRLSFDGGLERTKYIVDVMIESRKCEM